RLMFSCFFFSSRRRHTRLQGDWSSDVCSSDLNSRPKGKRRRRIWISIGIILALLIIFHRPILLGAIHWFAVHRAAKEHLKLSFRSEERRVGKRVDLEG